MTVSFRGPSNNAAGDGGASAVRKIALVGNPNVGKSVIFNAAYRAER